jgi:rRNA-processing protein FCF1
MKKTVLLDTNVLIATQDTGRKLSSRDAQIIRNAEDYDFFVHPIQLEDIEQDKNEERKKLLLSRIQQFKMLDKKTYSREYFANQGWRCNRRNDMVDNTLLACVLNPVVDYLVTEDNGIHAKAIKSGIDNRVLRLDDFHSMVTPTSKATFSTYVHELSCSELDVHSSFFDSLREDYGDLKFDRWFEDTCSRGQRKCWCIFSRQRLAALCIYKSEDNQILDDQGFQPNCDILKLCTVKVSASAYGWKMGECLLHQAFSYAVNHGIDFVYFTAFEGKQVPLIDLAESFGFQKYGHTSGWGDRVFGKYLRPHDGRGIHLSKAEYVRQYYPSYIDDLSVSKFLVPIRPQYHERLFPDISSFKSSLFGGNAEMYGAESNTIRKAYLCKSNIKTVEPGDLILFYRSQDRHSIQVLGVVDSILRSSDIDIIRHLVDRRTVYSIEEIKSKLTDSTGGLLVICLSVLKYFENTPVSKDTMTKLKIYPPQCISRLTEQQYRGIMAAANGQ